MVKMASNHYWVIWGRWAIGWSVSQGFLILAKDFATFRLVPPKSFQILAAPLALPWLSEQVALWQQHWHYLEVLTSSSVVKL